MGSTKYWPRATASAAHDDRFEDLRLAYYARLRSDRAQVVNLRMQLAGAEDPAPVYEAIRVCAHGMAGAAAVFEAADIMNTSRTLEHAAVETEKSRAHASEPALRAALDSLIELLNSICD